LPDALGDTGGLLGGVDEGRVDTGSQARGVEKVQHAADRGDDDQHADCRRRDPVTPGGLGIIDTVTPVLLVGFGLTRSVATLGVLAWRLVNFWLPIPTGAIAYVTLKVPRGTGLRATRRAIAEVFTRNSSARHQYAEEPAEETPAQDRS
jgi:hypothetical protein